MRGWWRWWVAIVVVLGLGWWSWTTRFEEEGGFSQEGMVSEEREWGMSKGDEERLRQELEQIEEEWERLEKEGGERWINEEDVF